MIKKGAKYFIAIKKNSEVTLIEFSRLINDHINKDNMLNTLAVFVLNFDAKYIEIIFKTIHILKKNRIIVAVIP